MHRKRVVCIVGTRPEAIKMAPVLRQLKIHHQRFDSILVATAQHREMLDDVLHTFKLRTDYDLNVMRKNQSLAYVTSRVLSALTRLLAELKPDVVLVQGDTTTAMATAIGCLYLRVPLGHVEAGLRTGNLCAPFPEEFNRRVIGLVARYHFAPTPTAAANLIREGVPRQNIFITGNTVVDALLYVARHTSPPPLPFPAGTRYVLLTCHRREIFGQPIREVFEAIREFARSRPDIRIWYPVHPNPNVTRPARQVLDGLLNVLLTAPLDYISFVHAMRRAELIVSDSGGIQEEAPSLGKTVLVLRDVTERPEAVAAGTSVIVGPHRDQILAELALRLPTDPCRASRVRSRNPYGDGRAASRILGVLTTGRCAELADRLQ
ncbi:MAG: non-hydrolyzing UDP-N-acetylglucosamine 2-epimerase [Kiritimatiellia bacterium]